MARKIETVIVDDLDGSNADETVVFSLDSRHYEIDLSTENASELRGLLKRYIKKSRAVAPPAPQNEARKIREWAIENGFEVSKRGRLHRDVVEAYRNAKKR